MDRVKFITYCWSIGTTSYRVKSLKDNLPKMLKVLEDFMSNNKQWNHDTQKEFYDELFVNNLVGSETPNRKDKDARQITSILNNIGLTDDKRNISEVGKELLKLDGTKRNNIFNIDDMSLLYAKQLIKFSFGDDKIRPIFEFIKLLVKHSSLTDEIVCYLVPLIINNETISIIEPLIADVKEKKKTIDDVLLDIINVNEMFLNSAEFINNLDEESNYEFYEKLIPNRKSPKFVHIYKPIFDFIYKCVNNEAIKVNDVNDLISSLSSSSSKTISMWKRLLLREYKYSETENIQKNVITMFGRNDYKKKFLRIVYLYMWKANLEDYFDLTKRWLKLSNIFTFDGDIVALTPTADIVFSDIFEKNTKFKNDVNFYINTSLEKSIGIDKLPNNESIIKKGKAKFGNWIRTLADINKAEFEIRTKRFEKLVSDKFTDEKLISLLELCKEYSNKHYDKKIEKKIQNEVTDQTSVPGIFEYLVEVAMYKISGNSISVLESINGNLDSDLLPDQYSSSLKADCVLEFRNYNEIPDHKLVMEMTLTFGENQKKAEVESVPRHLLDIVESDTNNETDYAIFVAPEIKKGVITEFREKHFSDTYSSKNDKDYQLGIVPIDVDLLEKIISKKITYKKIYETCQNAIRSSLHERDEWYQKEVMNRF